MEKEKYLAPSIVSLHVRAISPNDKDSLKSLLNLPENTNGRKFSYNLVRIYNTGYSNNRSKPVSENMPSYISFVNSSTGLINSRIRSLIKTTESTYLPLYSSCGLPNTNLHWSNSMKSSPNIVNPIVRSITSPFSDSEILKPTLNNSSQILFENVSQEESKNKLPIKNISSEILKSKEISNISETPRRISSAKKPLSVENTNKIQPFSLINQTTQVSRSSEVSLNKNYYRKSIDKIVPMRCKSSHAISSKERNSVNHSDVNASSTTRSCNQLPKSSSCTQKVNSSISVMNVINFKKNQNSVNNNEFVLQKNTQCGSINKINNNINNPLSLLISSNQNFLYPDPCDNESSVSFMTRLSELTSLVNDTIKLEKSRICRRRYNSQNKIT